MRKIIAPIDTWLETVLQPGVYPYPKARKLKAIAAWVNENTAVLGLRATTERGHCNTDRKPKGYRYVTSPGKGRYGTRIKLFSTEAAKGTFWMQSPLLDHNSAETYRCNFEVENWLARQVDTFPAAKRRKLTTP